MSTAAGITYTEHQGSNKDSNSTSLTALNFHTRILAQCLHMTTPVCVFINVYV